MNTETLIEKIREELGDLDEKSEQAVALAMKILQNEEFIELCQKTGKYPFVFFSPRVFAIEEHPTAWHETYEPNDHYPAAAITLSGYENWLITEADLDTGAMDCYCDLDLLTARGIVKI